MTTRKNSFFSATPRFVGIISWLVLTLVHVAFFFFLFIIIIIIIFFCRFFFQVQVWLKILAMVAVVINAVVLLNLIIAIMNDRYSALQVNSEPFFFVYLFLVLKATRKVKRGKGERRYR